MTYREAYDLIDELDNYMDNRGDVDFTDDGTTISNTELQFVTPIRELKMFLQELDEADIEPIPTTRPAAPIEPVPVEQPQWYYQRIQPVPFVYEPVYEPEAPLQQVPDAPPPPQWADLGVQSGLLQPVAPVVPDNRLPYNALRSLVERYGFDSSILVEGGA